MKKFMKKLLKKTEGFTLVELIVVIAILGILAAVAIPAYSGYIKKAEMVKYDQVLAAVHTAVVASEATSSDTVTEINVSNGTVTYDIGSTSDKATNDDFDTFMDGNTIPTELTATWTPNVWTISSPS